MAFSGSSVSAGNVFRLGVFGAIGGLVSFYLLDPGMREVESLAHGEISLEQGIQSVMSGLSLGAVIGAVIGTMLILGNEIQSPKPLRLARNLMLGVIVGALIGTIGVFLADLVFSPLAHTGVLPIIVFGRVMGWAIMGSAAGLCPGIVAGSKVRIRQGAIGGLVGGGIGGILFDALALMTAGGSLSRFVGFTITGFAIGVAVGLIEEFGKTFWITSISGGKEGRNYILTKPTSLLGRDELVDVPLFGDTTVLKRHAAILLTETGAAVVAQPGAAVVVNGTDVPQSSLQDGDVLEFGRLRFRFHQRAGAGLPMAIRPTDAGASVHAQVQPQYMMPFPAQPGVISTCSRLTVVSGPHAGLMFQLTNGAIVGRDPRCDLPLTADSRLSRQHARFILEDGYWVVEDGNSLNGLFVNGVRVARHVLSAGDQIGAGDSVLQVQ